jgi:hypothetical protein
MNELANSLQRKADRRGHLTVAEGAAGREKLRVAAKLIKALIPLVRQHQPNQVVVIPW